MSFYVMTMKFYLALPYIPHKTAPHLVEACFKLQFFFFPFLFFAS